MEMELDGLSKKLTLDEGITSSSGEESKANILKVYSPQILDCEY